MTASVPSAKRLVVQAARNEAPPRTSLRLAPFVVSFHGRASARDQPRRKVIFPGHDPRWDTRCELSASAISGAFPQ